MTDFLFGFTYPFRSIKFFFSHPVLIKYSIAPMIINLIIYGSVFFLTYKWLIGTLGNWIGVNSPDASFWLQFLHVVLLIIGFLLLLFICYLLFTILGNLVTAPFNEEISQRVEILGRCIYQYQRRSRKAYFLPFFPIFDTIIELDPCHRECGISYNRYCVFFLL